jgi:hypothetical protein
MQKYTWLDRAIAVCCLVFIGILFVSAYWDPSIRWLHFFQAWLYVAVIVLTYRQSRWGYFLGIVTAGFWNYGVLFVNNFFQAGRQQFEILLTTGTLPRPDLIISVPAVLAHFVMIGCCVWGYMRLPSRDWKDLPRFACSIVISLGFFALDMAIFQPRYLGIFARMFSPHLNL